MAFMTKKKRYKFGVQCWLEGLTEVPFVSGVLFAKLRLLDGGSFQEHSSREEVRNHEVRWNAQFSFVCKMCANANTGVLEPALMRVSVRKECKGGRSYQKLGFCDVDLAGLAGAGEITRRCLLEGYYPRSRLDNSVLRLRIRLNMIAGDPLFQVPESSKQDVAERGAAADSGSESTATGAGVGGVAAGADNECASSTTSSGFGSLTKKKTAYETCPTNGTAPLSSLTSCELSADEDPPPPTDTVDHPAGATCATCTHSRNSSNTSGEMSSKASGYGSSLSQQSQHSRQSSEGGDSAPDPRPYHASVRAELPPCSHMRHRARLQVERAVLSDTSVYLTPDVSLAAVQPDVIPRHAPVSPASDEYATPEATLTHNGHDQTFAMPSYFDQKKKAAIIITKAVQPLTNFQIFKQKSLNMIPALIERNRKNEELFNNFPFLTPLAHRKNSLLADASKLSARVEDEFYCLPSDPEVDFGSADKIDVRCRFKSLSNRTLDAKECDEDSEMFTSTPKEMARQSMFVKSDRMIARTTERRLPAVLQERRSYTGPARRDGWECSACGARDEGAPAVLGPAPLPLGPSPLVTGPTPVAGSVATPRRLSSTLNPSSGSLSASASENGSLERGHAERHNKPRPPAPHAVVIVDDGQMSVSCRVENTRVNPDSLIKELLAQTNLQQAVEDSAETSGLQLFITPEGTAELGSRQARQPLASRDYQRVVMQPHDHR